MYNVQDKLMNKCDVPFDTYGGKATEVKCADCNETDTETGYCTGNFRNELVKDKPVVVSGPLLKTDLMIVNDTYSGDPKSLKANNALPIQQYY